MNTAIHTAAALTAALALTATAHAATDPAGDLLPSFAGTPVGALDVLEASVSFNEAAGTFTLRAHTAGPIGGQAGVAYVFGFDRGGNANTPFASIGFPDVRFNSAVVLQAAGTGAVAGNTVPTSVNGNDIEATVAATLLPSNGLKQSDFTWALWAIDTRITGLARNADFAPSSNLAVAVVPEPQTWALMLGGLAALGSLARRRMV